MNTTIKTWTSKDGKEIAVHYNVGSASMNATYDGKIIVGRFSELCKTGRTDLPYAISNKIGLTADNAAEIMVEFERMVKENNEEKFIVHADKIPVKTMRQHFAEAHQHENRTAGRCPYCGGYCDGDCK